MDETADGSNPDNFFIDISAQSAPLRARLCFLRSFEFLRRSK